jgi:hypothetical protein
MESAAMPEQGHRFRPWNEGGDWQIVDGAKLEQGVDNMESTRTATEAAKRHDTISAFPLDLAIGI